MIKFFDDCGGNFSYLKLLRLTYIDTDKYDHTNTNYYLARLFSNGVDDRIWIDFIRRVEENLFTKEVKKPHYYGDYFRQINYKNDKYFNYKNRIIYPDDTLDSSRQHLYAGLDIRGFKIRLIDGGPNFMVV